ncbi:MAG: UTP--glucose-1-phosphate uridylyltransferase, partial [bacterium]
MNFVNLNTLARQALSGPDGNALKDARDKLAKILNFDKPNLAYFLALYSKYLEHKENKKITLGERFLDNNITKSSDNVTAYTTAVASDELMKQIPYINYVDLLKDKKTYCDYAKKTRLWLKKMQAGTGSSMTRTSYLADIHNIKEEEVKIGSKGTDLFINYKGKLICVAEAQILQAVADAKAGLYSEVILHDVVSSETIEAVNKIWNSQCVLDPSKKYIEYINDAKYHSKFRESVQSYQPTIDEQGELSLNRSNPGGHGFIAVDAFLFANFTEELPNKDFKDLISVLGNGEDLGSTPDPVMIGWIVKNKIPLVMLTTEKTEIDMKGGQIALVDDNGVYVTIVEKAQAEKADQLQLFEKMGLREGDNKSFFNTNVSVFNYEVLVPKIKKLVEEIGLDEFIKIITPDLIENTKKQLDKDGVTRKYTQLEGAMGSSILNLDRFWRKHYGEALVYFINIDRKNRTRFFSPIKTPFDFFMQFSSDRFKFDEKTIRLIDQRPGSLPFVDFKDEYYSDV